MELKDSKVSKTILQLPCMHLVFHIQRWHMSVHEQSHLCIVFWIVKICCYKHCWPISLVKLFCCNSISDKTEFCCQDRFGIHIHKFETLFSWKGFFNIFFLKVSCNLLLRFADKGVLASCLLNQYSLVMCLPNLLSLLKDHSTNFASKLNVTFFWRSPQHFVVRLNNVQIYVLYWNCGGISCPIFYWICLIVSYQHQQKLKT